MKFSIVALSCAVLFAGSASGATTVRGSKSNGSFKEAASCTTPACCIQHPNANGCVGSLLKSQANLPRHPRDTGPQPPSSVTTSPKNSAHASEKTTTVNTSKSNTFKEVEPTPPASEQRLLALQSGQSERGRDKLKGSTSSDPASEKTTTVNGSKSNTYRIGGGVNMSKEIVPTPPASEQRLHSDGAGTGTEKIKINTKSNTSERTTTINTTRSNSYKEIAPTPGPTPKPVENKNLNSNRTN